MEPLKAYRLVGVPMVILGLLYLLGPEPSLFGFGTRGGGLYWLTGSSLVGGGLALSTLHRRRAARSPSAAGDANL